MKKILCLLTQCLLCTLLFPGAAHAYFSCANGGPVSVSISPPLPDTWILTGKANGQSVDGQIYTVTVSMNGCKPLDTLQGGVFVGMIGNPTGVELNTRTGSAAGVAIKLGNISVANPPLPATAGNCGTNVGSVSAAGTGNIISRVIVCINPSASTLIYNSVITISGIQFIVTNNAAPPSKLDYDSLGRTIVGAKVGAVYVAATNAFGVLNFAPTGPHMLSNPFIALPTIGGLACTQAVSIKNVSLPDVYAAQLNSVGVTAGQTPFTVDLLSCGSGDSYIANAQWSFTSGATSNQIANVATNPASNVEVQILDSNMIPITVNSNSTLGTINSAGIYTANTHYSRYISNGPAGAGNVNVIANYILTYR